MDIKTKYNKGNDIYFIYNNSVHKSKIIGIYYNDGVVSYNFLIKKGLTNLDKDEFLKLNESNCFISVEEMITYYAEKIDR